MSDPADRHKETKTGETRTDRVQYILNAVFAGNQTAMANAIGSPQPTISRIICGTRNAGPDVLNRIAKHACVNRLWLLTGQGQPFDSENQLVKLIPLAGRLLPGSPIENPQEIIGGEPGLTSWAPTSAYAYRLTEESVSSDLHAQGLRDGDLLIIDSDVQQYLHAEVVLLRPVVVLSDSAEPRLAVVNVVDAKGHRFFSSPDISDPPPRKVSSSGRSKGGIRLFPVESQEKLLAQPEAQKESTDHAGVDATSNRKNAMNHRDELGIPFDSIVGVCIRQERLFARITAH